MLGRICLFVVLLAAAATGMFGCSRQKANSLATATSDSPQTGSIPQALSNEPVATIAGGEFCTSDDAIAPSVDAWPSEAITDRISVVLKKMKTLPADDAALAGYFATPFALNVSDTVQVRFEKDGLTTSQTDTNQAATIIDAAAVRFLNRLRTAGHQQEIRLLKVVGIDVLDEVAVTKIRCESIGSDQDVRRQTIQTWQCEWHVSADSLQLRSATLLQEDLAESTNGTRFADQTLAVLGDQVSFQQQLQFGLQYWLARITSAHGMNYFSKHGLAVGDVNGDGRDDLFVCQPAGLPNRLYLQQSDGTLVDKSAEYHVDLLDRTTAALLVDLDNDGDQDLAISTIMGVQIYKNHQQTFVHKGTLALADEDLQGISAADYDNDGDLDLYQIVDYASHQSRTRQGLPSFVYHNANDGGSNRLFRNDIQGDRWTFTDVTTSVGLDQNNQRHSLAAAWDDFDADGDPDLYVANDYGQNCLYQNNNGTFVDVAAERNVTDFGSGMSVAWGDYDRDGHDDLYVSNMFSSAGNRITTQSQFLPNISDTGRELYQRFAKGNSLFRGTELSQFEETGRDLNVEIARWAWGSQFADINNDGWEDLVVANGYISTDDSGDL